MRSQFSKYSLNPERGINFGPFLVGTKKSRPFTIKNEGEFDFRFTLSKATLEETAATHVVTENHSSTNLPKISSVGRKSRQVSVNYGNSLNFHGQCDIKLIDGVDDDDYLIFVHSICKSKWNCSSISIYI